MPLSISQPPLWRTVMRASFSSLHRLAAFLEWNDDLKSQVLSQPPFPLNVPLRLAKKIEKGTLDDPILRQFVPLADEAVVTPGYFSDPVGDQDSREAPRLLHKYAGRALLVLTGACAMNCRYCFRQNFDYAADKPSFQKELGLIGADPSIREVILSGGDPLALSDRVLEDLLQGIERIPHVKRIRFHSRFPIGIPERVDKSFLDLLSNCTRNKSVWFVTHVNHHRELDEDVLRAIKEVRMLGIPVLNQAVLLKGVNDSYAILRELCETLADNGIQPYYLHQFDRVQGGAHFEVSQEKGAALVKSLQETLSGYAVPRFVKEVPGAPGKTIIIC